MLGIEFPVTIGALVTVLGAAMLAAILAKIWFEHYLPDWLWTPLVVGVVCIVTAMGAQTIIIWAEGWPAAPVLVSALLGALFVGFFGATIGVFGYETVTAILATIGVGPKTEKARLDRAERVLKQSGFEVYFSRRSTG